MLLVSEEEAQDLMAQAIRNAVEDGDTAPCFSFEAHNVMGIHTHKKGVGDGVWFRTYTEQVFNSFGMRSEFDRDLYDTVEN